MPEVGSTVGNEDRNASGNPDFVVLRLLRIATALKVHSMPVVSGFGILREAPDQLRDAGAARGKIM